MPTTAKKPKKSSRPTVRLSVTLPKDVHDELQRMADQQDVPLAWTLRKAAEQYVENQNPLFATHRVEGQEPEWS